MTNLSKELRQSLSENFSLPAINNDAIQYSSDGTIKTRFKTFDGHLVEGVLIPADNRQTACVSSQVGCSLSCKFCATGYMDRKRNLILMKFMTKWFCLIRWLKKLTEKTQQHCFYGNGRTVIKL